MLYQYSHLLFDIESILSIYHFVYCTTSPKISLKFWVLTRLMLNLCHFTLFYSQKYQQEIFNIISETIYFHIKIETLNSDSLLVIRTIKDHSF